LRGAHIDEPVIGDDVVLQDFSASLIAWATAWQGAGLRDEMTTLAPWLAMVSAMALPMPREEPVMIAVFPERSKRLIGGRLSLRGLSCRFKHKTKPG